MKRVVGKIKPRKGFAHVFHIILTALVPIIVYVLIRMSFNELAVAVVILSKWRMFAVKPRFWPANVRANAVDIIVGISTVIFMTNTSIDAWQLFWTGLFILWQVVLKPRSTLLGVSIQSLAGQSYGLMALFVAWPDAPMVWLVLAAWAVCYLSARHYLSSFDEVYTSLYSHMWGYFAGALMWLSSHWLTYYGVVAQPTLLLSVLGFGLGSLYYLNETDKLSNYMRRQIVFIMIAVVVVVLVFSDWGDKTI